MRSGRVQVAPRSSERLKNTSAWLGPFSLDHMTKMLLTLVGSVAIEGKGAFTRKEDPARWKLGGAVKPEAAATAAWKVMPPSVDFLTISRPAEGPGRLQSHHATYTSPFAATAGTGA